MKNLFGSVLTDLQEVHKMTEIIHRFPENEQQQVYSLLELSPLEANLRPGIVLLVGRLINSAHDRIVILAAMVQLLFLGVRIHERVNEDDAHPDEQTKLAILAGDYFLSRFFGLTASTGVAEFLRPLSEIICRISAGAITRLQAECTAETIQDAIRQETAELIATGCQLAGQDGGASDADQRALYQLGFDLGMGYGLMDRGYQQKAWKHIQAARTGLLDFPPGSPRDALDALVAYLLDWPRRFVASVER